MIETNLTKKSNDVAIIGCGLRLPGCSNTPSQLWDNLIKGFDAIVSTSERWSDTFSDNGQIASKFGGLIDFDEFMYFDPLFFGINPSDAKQIDPQQKLLLKSTWEAFEDAQIDPLTLRGSDTSVFIGASSMEYAAVTTDPIKPTVNCFNINLSGVSNRISYCFDLRGTSLTVDTACSSSLNAVNLGYDSIVNGKSEYSIVGGVNFIINPQQSRSFTEVNVIGKSGRCKSFDESADGFVRSEGAVVLILKDLTKAIQDGNQIYSVIKGSSSNVDGTLNKGNYFAPSKISQTNNIIKAFESTNGELKPSDIDFFELHGTGTQIGDPIEVGAVSEVFKSVKSNENPLLIGSVKSNVGHLEPASGVASLAKVILMFKNRQFVKNIHFDKPNPNINFQELKVKVCTENTPFPTNKLVSIAINNFGITGSNSCLLLSEYKKTTPSPSPSPSLNKSFLIPMSSNSKRSMEKYKQKLIENIDKLSNSISFQDFINYHINSKTTKLASRSVLIAKDWSDINQIKIEESFISTKSNKSGNIIKDNNKNPTLIFVFCGLGPQWNKSGVQLMETEPVFKESMNKIDQEFSKLFGYSILSKLRDIKDDDLIAINDFSISQPTIFMLQVSLFQLYKSWGIVPSINVGHSFGEISSAYCSGMIDLETSCFIIFNRINAQSKTIGSGKMAAIGLNESEFIQQYQSQYPNVEISCYNSPTSIVISGSEQDLNNILASLKENNIFSVMLGTPSALHSSKQSIIKNEILNNLKDIKHSSPNIQTFSTVTSNLFNDSTPFSNNYIYSNIRKPVLFQQTFTNIFEYIEENDLGSNVIIVELSPNPTLTHYINEMIPKDSNYFYIEDESISIITSLNKKKLNEQQEIQNSICQIYCNGFNVNFKSQLPTTTTTTTTTKDFISYDLPRYQWDESNYFKLGRIHKQRTQGPPINVLGYRNDLSPFISFTTYIDIKEEPFKFLKGHQSRGRYLFPGNGYTDNILKIFPQQDVTFHLIEYRSPLLLKEGVKQILSTNIYPSSKNEYRFNFHYKDIITGKWILSCSGRFSITKHNSDLANQKVDIQSIKERCNWTTIKRNEFYEALKIKTALSLTLQFQCIEEAYYGYNCCLAKISLDATTKLSNYDNDSFLNICTIDGGFQPLGLFRNDPDIAVIDKIEVLKFYSDNIPKRAEFRETEKFIYSYTEFIRQIGNSVYANITTFLSDGTILFNTPVVCFSAISTAKNDLSIENPNHQLYSTYLQSIESPLSVTSPNAIIDDNLFNQYIPTPTTVKNIRKAMTTCMFGILKKKYQSITPAQIKSSTNEFLISNYLKIGENDSLSRKNLAESLFNSLRNNADLIDYSNLAKFQQAITPIQKESISKITKLLLQESTDTSTLLSSTLMEPLQQTLLIDQIISISISPLINEKIVFKIIEIGCGIGLLSQVIINKLNLLLKQNPLAEIDIEYTYTDSQDQNSTFLKDKLTSLIDNAINIDNDNDLSSRRPSLIFKLLDLNNRESMLSISPSNYDMVVLNNLNGVKDLNQTIQFIYSILNPNGYFILIDTLFQPISTNLEFELYEQFLKYNYFDSSKDSIETWKSILIDNFKFLNFFSTTTQPWVLLCQKPKYIDTVPKESLLSDTIAIYDQVIIYGQLQNVDSIKGEAKQKLMDVNKHGTDIYFIHTWDEFESQVESCPLTDESLVVFVNTINQVLFDYKEITLDYIKINQYLLKKECSAKYILCTKNAFLQTSNALANSTIGAFRYFCEFPQLNLYLMDFDDTIYEKSMDFLIYAHELTESNQHIQREYIFRDDKIFYERVRQETNLKLKYQSNSYVSEPNQLYAKLNQNLHYQLKALDPVIASECVEIKVLASGINFKDNLVYRRLVPPEAVNHLGNQNEPEFGYECSGIVTRVGEGVTRFKAGDEVVGLGFNCTGSYVVLEQYRFVPKPKNLSFVEAASIPVVYLTSYYSLFVAGYLNIEKKESVLIHGGTGGIGLACLNLLKAKGFKGLLFVTVGSKEKENYLRLTYGSLITGIYSSKNTDYLFEIKKKIQQVTGNDSIFKQFGVSNKGIDLIINTLSSEFMDANFNSLVQGGRVIDLSVTHMNSQDTTDFRKFRYSISYSTVELLLNGFERNRLILQEIMDMFVNQNLNLLPIKEFPVSQIKEAIEYINERKHIGKIVVNHQDTDLVTSTLSYNDNEFYKDYLITNPNYKISNNCNLGKTVLLTGQTGLSLTIIKWILQFNSIDQPVENIIVISKSPIKYELEHLICYCKFILNDKIKIFFRQVDVSDCSELATSLLTLFKDNPNLPGVSTIFHNAFVPTECDQFEIDMEHLEKAHNAKTIGFVNLNTISESLWSETIKNFVISSSLTSVLGGQRQCGYVSANCTVDAFARLRASQGLPVTLINWGVLGGTGFVSRNENASKFFEHLGFVPISLDMLMGTLDLILQNPSTLNNKIVTSFNYSNVNAAFKDHKLSYKLSYFLNPVIAKGLTFDDNEISIREDIISKFSEYLSTEKSKLGLDIKLIDYGSDSLLLLELKNYIDKKYAPNILSIAQLQNVTINQLIQAVINAVSKLKKKPTLNKNTNSTIEFNNLIDWKKEIELDSTIKPSNEMVKQFKENNNQIYKNGDLSVLITGPTTFMGTNLLFNLLLSSKTKFVYCMLPKITTDEVLSAIIENLKIQGMYNQLTVDQIAKIQPVAADFTLPLFALDQSEYIELSNKIDLVVNAASNTTKHYCYHISYQDTNKEYLTGVSHLIRFACSERIKRIVQISTLGRYSDANREVLDEYYFPEVDFSFIANQNSIVSGYIQSKIVAEYHLKQAAERGIPCFIVRIPFCFPGENGVGREVDFTQLFLQSCYSLNSFPTESHIQLYTAPVTWYARNVILMIVGSDLTIDGCWKDTSSSPIPNLLCHNLFGGGIDFGVLLRDVAKDLLWNEISFEQFIKKSATNENESCRKLASFAMKSKGDFITNIGVIPGSFKPNDSVKQLLEINNSFDGWEITKQLVFNHLSYVFKKKII